MRHYRKIFLFLFVHLCFVRPTAAQTSALYDSSQINITHRSAQLIAQFKKDKDFQYPHVKTPNQTNWLELLFAAIFKFFQLTPVRIIIYVLLMIGAVYIILRIIGNGNWKFFLNKSPGKDQLAEESANDYEKNNISEYIHQAIAQQQYSLAVRWLYIQGIRLLFQKDIIQYHANKTNHDYLHELAATNFYQDFNYLTRNYEYYWYGSFPLDKNRFDFLYQLFQQFYQKINED